MIRCIAGWIEYLAALALLVFFLVLFGSYAVLVLLVLCGCIPFISFFLTLAIKKQTEFQCGVRAAVVGKEGGNEVQLKIEKKNPHSFLRFLSFGTARVRLVISHGFQKEEKQMLIEVPIRPVPSCVEIPISVKYCGRMQIKLTKVWFPAFFHLFLFQEKLSEQCEYIIMPQLSEIGDMDSGNGGAGNDEAVDADVPGENSSEIRDIRFYHPGDRLQKIHWKASARKEEWMVKEYAGTLSREAVLLLELSGTCEELDASVGLAYSFMQYQLDNFGSMNFLYWDEMQGEFRKRRLSGMEDATNAIQEVFFTAKYEEPEKALKMVRKTGEAGGTIFYCAGRELTVVTLWDR